MIGPGPAAYWRAEAERLKRALARVRNLLDRDGEWALVRYKGAVPEIGTSIRCIDRAIGKPKRASGRKGGDDAA